MKTRMGIGLVLVVLAAWLAGGPANAAGKLEVGVGDKGLATLRSAGTDLLANGDFRVTGAFFQRPNGEVVAADLGQGTISRDKSRLTWTFAWGSVSAAYAPGDERLGIEVEVATARDADTLVAVYLQLAELRFPQPPTLTNPSFLFYTSSGVAHNIGAPGVLGADHKDGLVAFCNEQMDRPLAFGLGAATNKDKNVFPVLAYTGRHPAAREKFPWIDRPIHAGGRDRFSLSLRFGASGGLDALTADLYRAYAKAFPYELTWDDRRPIAQLHLSSAGRGWAGNPRGWHHGFSVPDKMDVATDEGRATFRADLLRYADNATNILKQMNAQGMVVWDVEGQEQPHMISYLGDPRSLPPEMEPAADDFFRKFREAGLRTGICIRPQRPMRAAYSNGVEQIGWVDRRARFANLCSKIDVAKKRWNATLFYIDSNIEWYGDPVSLPDAGGYTAGFDAQLLRDLIVKYPDTLFMPEWEDLRAYAYSAPYSQLNYNKLTAPPAGVLLAYPQAFLVNGVSKPEVDQQKAALVESVRKGNILYFAGWWASAENAVVKTIYEEAGTK